MTIANKPCLVLNKNWVPVGTVPLQRAILMLCKERARVIEPESYQAMTWDDWAKLQPSVDEEKLASANAYFRIPEIILLSHYDKLPAPKVHFSRRNLFKRDNMMCQYCGKTPGSAELTIDHVVPRCQGGQTVWENVVLCCVECNRKKADKTPEQAGLKLRKKPKRPDPKAFRYNSFKAVKSWAAFLGEAYFNVELQNDIKD